MKMALIHLSPNKDGISDFLLEEINNAFKHKAEIIDDYYYYDSPPDLSSYDRIILAAPVYFRGLPSRGLDFLQKVEQENSHSGKPLVYYLSICGFPDSENNLICFEIVKNWCEHCNFDYGYSVGLGFGIRMTPYPMEDKPKEKKSVLSTIIMNLRKCFAYDFLFFGKNLSKHGYQKTMEALIGDIQIGKKKEDILIRPFLSKNLFFSNSIVDTMVYLKKNIIKDR